MQTVNPYLLSENASFNSMLLPALCMHSDFLHPEFHCISHCRIPVQLPHFYMFPPSYASLHRHPIHRNQRVQSFSLTVLFLRHTAPILQHTKTDMIYSSLHSFSGSIRFNNILKFYYHYFYLSTVFSSQNIKNRESPLIFHHPVIPCLHSYFHK